ncbi:MAG TPA: heat-inducible transcription repressor HrcA [Eubacteriaceae bacterium]|nr:heat-inducible transcription repressor HrcA [Eubacteriaceae bacterium]
MDEKQARKLTILRSIIQDYIQTAEPIGSRTIAKKYDIGISAATIRNEMSDLEEMGFLLQPHTSAGRIPSQKAYRLYVDELMDKSDLSEELKNEIRKSYQDHVEEMDKAIKHTANVISRLTSYTSVVSLPQMEALNFKHVQLIPIVDEKVIMVVVTKENIVKHYEFKLSRKVNDGELQKMSNILNHVVKDKSFKNVGVGLSKKIDSLTMEENTMLQEIVMVFKEILLEKSDNKVYSNGITNILDYPEFNDVVKAKEFLKLLEKKNKIADILTKVSTGDLNVVIGSENIVQAFRDCTLITATYRLEGETIGSIGVVGPVRMNYEHVISVMDFLGQELNKQLNDERAEG